MADTETGKVCEQPVQLTDETGVTLEVRRVVMQRHQPTRPGDREVAVLTTLPNAVADAVQVTMLYLKRWRVEGMFQVLTDPFRCELNSLGDPRAALFVFCVALVSFNSLSTVQAALMLVHGADNVTAGWSDYYLVEAVQGTFRGMMIALPAPAWKPFRQMSVAQFALTLQQGAALVNLKRFSSTPRGPQKTPAKAVYVPKHPPVSTARLLAQKKNKRSP